MSVVATGSELERRITGQFDSLEAALATDGPHEPSLPLGQHLVAAGLITEEERRSALGSHEEVGADRTEVRSVAGDVIHSAQGARVERVLDPSNRWVE